MSSTNNELAPGYYWIARAIEGPDATFSWSVRFAAWDGRTWCDEGGPGYDFANDDTVRVLRPLEAPPSPPPPEPMWEPHLTRQRWYRVYHRELETPTPNNRQREAAEIADREVPEYRGLK